MPFTLDDLDGVVRAGGRGLLFSFVTFGCEGVVFTGAMMEVVQTSVHETWTV